MVHVVPKTLTEVSRDEVHEVDAVSSSPECNQAATSPYIYIHVYINFLFIVRSFIAVLFTVHSSLFCTFIRMIIQVC